jgi:Raf kinase inhibitor-like YbhB/YbcL family protein
MGDEASSSNDPTPVRRYRAGVRFSLPVIAVGALVGLIVGCGERSPESTGAGAAMSIAVSSNAFSDGGTIPRRHACDGADVSPPLTFVGLPTGTRDLALLVEDPDAPGGTFVHWVAWGIDPAKAAVGEGEEPAGSGTNGFGRRGYGGPCPPRDATHRYVFTVFALSRPTGLPPGASAQDLRASIAGAVLAQGSLMGRYTRG